MTFQPTHYGLVFSVEHVERARQKRDDEAMRPIWQFFLTATGGDALSQGYLDALRYRINDDADSLSHASEVLQRVSETPPEMSIGGIRGLIAAAHIFEMLRHHPLTDHWRDAWLSRFSAHVQQLQHTATDNALMGLWQMTLSVAAGVVLEDETSFQQGVEHFKQTINQGIHPEGYMRSTVGQPDGETVSRQVSSVCALAMTAEIAAQAGTDLWAYEDRGVSIGTAAQYLIYYYFYPEKWNWEQGFDRDYMAALFKQSGAFMEMVNYRLQPRGITDLLDEQAPMLDAYGGGLTSLTHHKRPAPKKKRRGLFG